MKFLNYTKVLCLSPHPDDIEYSMSGLINSYSDTQFHICNLSYGTLTDKTTHPSRYKEVLKFWDKFNSNVQYHNLAELNVNLIESNSSILLTNIENLMRVIGEVQAVFGPPLEDTHNEHKVVNGLLKALARHKPISIIEYKTSSTLPNWIPNFRVELTSNDLTNKLESLRDSFVSQLDGHYFETYVLESFHQDFFNLKRGIKWAEHFKLEIGYL